LQNAVRALRALSLTLILGAVLTGCGGGSSRTTYSVSASISGLSGSGLQLQLNSGMAVGVGTAGTVTFPNRLDNGVSYQVKVASQPHSPAQTCLVSNGSGTIAAADVSNVTITCAFGLWTWVAGADGQGEIDDTVPGSRRGGFGWTDHLGQFWLTGGIDLDDRGVLEALWKFDVSTGQFTQVSVTIPPGGRVDSATWVDSSNRLWLFGGECCGPSLAVGGGGELSDLWMYDPAAQTWTLVAQTSAARNGAGVYGTQGVSAAGNVPGARVAAAWWIDSSDNLWLFGGAGADVSGNVGSLSDLWRFNPTSGQWTWIAGSQAVNDGGNYGMQGVASTSNAPPAGAGGTAWVDSAGAFWMFGGATSTGYLGAMWKFDPVSSEWTWVNGSSSPNPAASYGSSGVPAASNTPGGRTGGAFWTDPSGRFWLFGGFAPVAANLPSNGRNTLNDMWVFSPSTGEWTWVAGPSTEDQPGNYGTLNVPALTNLPWGPGSPIHWQSSSGNFYLFGDGDQTEAIWQFAPAQ
jgi:N-acetylneuraminic acid mutarotase